MTKQITVSENCYAELLRRQRETENDVNGKALSMSNIIGSAWSEIRLLKDEQDKLRESLVTANKTIYELNERLHAPQPIRPFLDRCKAVFFP